MEWIKAKYDRLLLGVLGAIALIVGGWLVMKVMGFKSTNFPQRGEPSIKTDFGTTDAVKKLEAANTRLAEPAHVKAPLFASVPISLFTSAPVLKTSDQKVVAILDP